MQPIFYVIPFFIVSMLVEWRLLVHRQREQGELIGYTPKDTAASLSMGLGMLAVNAVAKLAALALYLWLFEFRLFDIPFTWWSFAIAFILDDLRYYWYHRIAHRCRWVWAEHVNHHSSQHYNLTTALRQSWTGTFTGMFTLLIPLVLLGFHPNLLAFVAGFNLVYQFWIHTEVIGKMGKPIELIFNTPSHHRVHHATNPRYLDANYAGTLIIWDRMFGTFVEELDEDVPRYGLVHNIATFNPFRVAFHEWIGMFRDVMRPGLTIRQRLGYLFMPPGWTHDGSRDTSETLKARYVRMNPSEAGKPGLPDAGVLEPGE